MDRIELHIDREVARIINEIRCHIDDDTSPYEKIKRTILSGIVNNVSVQVYWQFKQTIVA